MEEKQASERQIEAIAGSDEGVVCVLGRAFLASGGPVESLQRSVVILTDKALYLVGVQYIPDEQQELVRRVGQNRLPLEDIIGLDLVKRPVADKIRNIGGAMLLIGTALLLAGMIDGSVMGLVFGLFLGAVWLMVPGALMLVHWKTGAETYLQVAHRDGTIAAACRRYPEAELGRFVEACEARIAGNGDLPRDAVGGPA